MRPVATHTSAARLIWRRPLDSLRVLPEGLRVLLDASCHEGGTSRDLLAIVELDEDPSFHPDFDDLAKATIHLHAGVLERFSDGAREHRSQVFEDLLLFLATIW